MDLLRDETGKVQNTPLIGFQVVNILGVLAVVKLDFQQEDGIPVSVQVSVTAQQCRELARQLLHQAEVLELERPTLPQ
ncbi:hypothetical protein RU07_15845 [Agrobacterium tumefaciens]|uniref:Uncharacterized protein n=1 Tax=Agrobacterium tumefaciens TaxID=358 RepID=A0A0D0JZZ9_AGRTU|nr:MULTISPECIES: hypothetical protein [unclassified Rhizobium]KIQ01333.1 hypothetical protein RU07_15845 [Agrobacterium tumefaciens]MBD8688759.1 hypothetical protein [Rhizobium sp. CFBP 13644]MBD8694020.1 hypothetical protein [Rhizobium sp. CFBP 13717]